MTHADAKAAFEYVVLRAVPRVDRGELINVGVVVYSQGHDFLGCSSHVDEARLRAIDATADVVTIRAVLDALSAVCRGDADDRDPSAGGPARARFGWLAAPRSTVVQPGPIHTGMTADPAAELDRLMRRLVL